MRCVVNGTMSNVCCCTFKVHLRCATRVVPVLNLVAPPADSLLAGVTLHQQGVPGALGTHYLATPPAVVTAVELRWEGGGGEGEEVHNVQL